MTENQNLLFAGAVSLAIGIPLLIVGLNLIDWLKGLQ